MEAAAAVLPSNPDRLLFQQVYTLTDRAVVGQFVGADAFSAVGSTTAITSMFMSMCMGASNGAGVVVAQYHGAGDKKNTAAAIANGVYINLAVTVVMTVIALLTTRPILRLLNTPDSLMEDAASYMLIYMGGLIAVTAYYVPFSILQALGDSKTPLIFLIFCSALNIVLDIIFVVPFGMGVNGAAIATVLAQLIAAACCITYTFRKVPVVRAAVKNARPNKGLMVKTVKVSLPAGFQYSLVYLSSIVLQRVVNGFGSDVIGAFTATTQMQAFSPLDEKERAAYTVAVEEYRRNWKIQCSDWEKMDATAPNHVSISAIIRLYNSCLLQPNPAFTADLNYYYLFKDNYGCDDFESWDYASCTDALSGELDVNAAMKETTDFLLKYSFK